MMHSTDLRDRGHDQVPVSAAIGGVTVAEAYERQGIPLPSVGTQVVDPVTADALQAGDVGMREGDFVMALGDGEALVSGQVQSVEDRNPPEV